MNNSVSSLCAIPRDAGAWLLGKLKGICRFAAADHPYVYLSGCALGLAAALIYRAPPGMASF